MIKKLILRNFQSHRFSEFEFDEGLNVIVGKSDNGKSAALRALRWLCKNKPSGDSICSWWGGVTEVTAELYDGNTISRIKDGSKNIYHLNDLEFTAFGTEVPKEIVEVLNINDINLQAQFDRPFLLDSSAGEVAVHFNKIAHIDQIDSSVKKITSWIKVLENDVNVKTEMINTLNKDAEKFLYLDKMETDVEVLESLELQTSQQNARLNKLKGLIQSINTADKEIVEKSKDLLAENAIVSLLELYTTKDSRQKEVSKLKAHIASIHVLAYKLEEERQLISTESMVTSILGNWTSREQESKKVRTLKDMAVNIRTTEVQLDLRKKTVKELETRFIDNFPETCPLCGQNKKIS